jgi:hypothetical protein
VRQCLEPLLKVDFRAVETYQVRGLGAGAGIGGPSAPRPPPGFGGQQPLPPWCQKLRPTAALAAAADV